MGILRRVCAIVLAFAAAAAQGAPLERLWQASIQDEVYAAPLPVDLGSRAAPGVIIIGKGSGLLCHFDSKGKPLGRLRFPSEITGGAVAADLDGNGCEEVIAEDTAGNLKAWMPGRGIVWERRLDSGVKRSEPLLVDILGDRRPEIVVATAEGRVWCFDSRGRVVWKHELAEGWWPNWGIVAAPLVAANADGLGRPEILITSREGVYCLASDGRRRWTRLLSGFPRAAPVAADFDGDGRLEIMLADWKGCLRCLDAATGNERWKVNVGGEPQGPVLRLRTSADARAAIVGSDGRLGIIAGRDIKWVWGTGQTDGKRAVTPAAVLDFDADGQTDVAFMTESGHLVIVASDGTELARVKTGVVPQAPPLVADINRDRRLEIVIAGAGGEIECYSLPPASRTVFAEIPSPRFPIRSAQRPGSARLAGISVKALWWDRFTALPALVVANKAGSSRRIQYDLTLRHPDGRLASTAGMVSTAGRGASAVAIPYIECQGDLYSLRCRLMENGKALPLQITRRIGAVRPPASVCTLASRPCEQEPPLSRAWPMPLVCGRDFWHVARYQPEKWQEYGLAQEPFITQAVPRVWADPQAFKRDFALDSPARRALLADSKPIMLMNEYFGPQAPVDPGLYRAFERDFGARFIGFASHEWAYGAVTGWYDNRDPPRSRAEAAKRLAQELHRQMSLTYGKLYAGEGYRLPHHLAFREGLTAGYAEVGENIPCTPLQVAVLRGAARQYGRPWGFCIAAWFRNSVTTYDSPAPDSLRSSGGIFSGPFAGHSVSLMERMLYLGYLSGGTFVQHESDAFAGSIWLENYGEQDRYHISPLGLATRRWFEFTRRHPDRGVPYAPFALMIDANHGWCPAEDQVWRAFPKTQGERAMEQITHLFFPWGFSTANERGYLTHGPFGDTVDVISHEASMETLARYRVIMLLGDVPLSEQLAARLGRYVESGGTLVVDAGHEVNLLGRGISAAWARKAVTYAAGARRTSDGALVQTAPYACRPLREGVGKTWWLTGDGRPLVVEMRRGKGQVVLIAVPHMLDICGRPVPFLQDALTRLYDGLLPIQVRGDIEFTIARNDRGWVIGLINSNGVVKRPTEPERIGAGPGEKVEITAPWRAAATQEWTNDTTLKNLSSTGTRVLLGVPPGQVRVVFLKREWRRPGARSAARGCPCFL